uniref:B cell scaffold protein with ankyrin repeats 1 n=1 Tax=Myripristis murdjan TaxID=586833 RepID=A0A667YWR7_9TELE
IIYEAEAEQWATYLRSAFTGPIQEGGICCYDIATVSSRRDDFLRLGHYKCKLLILSRGMLEALCQLRRFFLARVLNPAAHVVVLLCGVESLAPLLELVPLNGEECTQISSEQDAHEYLSTVTDIAIHVSHSLHFLRSEQKPEQMQSSGAHGGKSSAVVVPSRVPCGSSMEMFILLKDKVAGGDAEVEFSGDNQRVRVKPLHWNEHFVMSTADFPAGNVNVTLHCGGETLSRTQLQYYSTMDEITRLLRGAANPVDFMCQLQMLNYTSLIVNTGTFLARLCFNQNSKLAKPPSAELHPVDVPSLLHFAAQNGFKSVSSLLLQCPGAERALRTANRHGQTPTDIAKSHGHKELHIFPMLLWSYVPWALCSQGPMFLASYVPNAPCSWGPMFPRSHVPGALCSQDPMFPRSHVPEALCSQDPMFPRSHVPGALCFQGSPSTTDTQKEEHEEEEGEEDPYALLGVNDEEYDTILSSSNTVPIANRPPAPTPRPESTQVKEDRIPFIAQVFQKKMSQGDADMLYSLPTKQARARGDSISSTYDTFVPSQSPGLQQLIELQERVKGGSLTMDEALERFSDWQRVQKGMDSIQQVAHGASLSQHRAADSIIQRIRSFKLTLAHPSGSHIGVTNILHFSVDIRSLVF